MGDQPNGDGDTASEKHADGDETSNRSYGRRALMLGAATAGVGAAASLVAGAEPADAESPDTAKKVVLGKANTATATTSISMAVDGDSGVEGIDTSSGGGYGLYGTSENGTGIYGTITGDTLGFNAIEGVDASTGSGGGAGVTGSSTNGTGVIGASTNGVGVTGIHSTGIGSAVAGVDDSGNTGSHGIYGSSGTGYGVYGTSSDGTGIYGTITGDTSGHFAVEGSDASTGAGGGAGVGGFSTNGTGVYATSTNGTGVSGITKGNFQSGVAGLDESLGGGHGVYGSSTNGIGVYGTSDMATGVYGNAVGENGYGVYGNAIGQNGYGVYGNASGQDGTGVYAYTNGTEASYGVYAYSANSDSLYVDGSAQVTGTLSKGGGSFKIDHPVDPANKYLFHSFVESPDMMNVYNGNVTLDSFGKAMVELPDWFEALNRDFRYQLTAIGSFAPLYVSKEIAGGKFEIAGGVLDQRVSWQVTGIRQDTWANANRIPVEVDKKAEDRGRYLHPEAFGGEAITALAKPRDRVRRHRSITPNI